MAEELDDERLSQMEKSLAALEFQVREQTLRTQSGTRVSLVVGIIVIAVLFVWLSFIAWKIKEEMRPEQAAETVAAMFTNRIPALKDALIEHAPEVVANARQMAVSDIPVARKWAEEKSLALVDEFAQKLEDKADEMVGQIVEAHRTEIQPLVEAAANAGDAAKLQATFRKSLEELFGRELDDVLKDFNSSMTGIEHRLDRYKLPDSQLNPDERLEKTALIAVMSLVEQAVHEQGAAAGIPKPAPAPATTTQSPAPDAL
ncbi:MAG: hypothetical protein ACLQVA_03670 [Candidatus Brocadiia bacterium]